MTIDRASRGATLDPRRRPPPALAVVLLALAFALPACAGGGLGPRPAALTVPSDSLPLSFLDVADSSAWSVPGDSVAGEALISVTDGDYRLPALAPDGRRVAYVQVVRSDTAVRSRLWVRELDADTGRVLRGYDEIDEYGVASYSPWVRQLAWRGWDTLVAQISDGDVGTTTAEMAVPSGDVLTERYTQPDPPEALPPAEAALRDSLIAAFPSWRRAAVTSLVRQGGYLRAEGGLLLQKRYADEDAHVRWLEWATGDTTRVLTMAEARERQGDLRPGLSVGARALFPVVHEDRAHLFGFRPDVRLAWWGAVPTGPSHYAHLRSVARSAEGALVQLDVASDGCCWHHPVLWVTLEAVTEWTDLGVVADVDALLEHRLVAWTHWTSPDSVRALRVHRLER